MVDRKALLGSAVRNARKKAGFNTLQEWAAHLDISDRTLGDLERGHGAGPNTLADVENALGWNPGKSRRFLDGEEDLEDMPAPPQRAQAEPDDDARGRAAVKVLLQPTLADLLAEASAAYQVDPAEAEDWLLRVLTIRRKARERDGQDQAVAERARQTAAARSRQRQAQTGQTRS
ncbi:hypothetical protein [Amycolatopsis sp. YIM 10]|uniref:hypothetical protein n=1 Tax=Amycolatopsis sp. YIM 10 TaxID=2653857 RepID=UPI00128FFBED|nr:hypothetical protein [Amycolatopsis sp. YIM 10]